VATSFAMTAQQICKNKQRSHKGATIMANTNFKSLSDKIRKAKTVKELQHLDMVSTNLYDLELLTVNQLSRLDVKIMERNAEVTA
jgi:hypothetical protein